MANLLEPMGFVIEQAENGQQGLTIAAQLKPDVIITDLSMPVMDGFEMLSHLRSAEELKNIIVIVSSASVYEMDRQRSLDTGGDDFLAKPVQIHELLQMLEKHLNITWEYESIPVEIEDTSIYSKNIASREISVPSKDDLSRLLELAKQGRMKKIIEEAKKIEQLDNKSHQLLQEIILFAKKFQADKIESLITGYLCNIPT